jgi:LruC domain-containing protein
MVGDGAPQLLTPEAGQTDAVFILAQNTTLLTQPSGQGCNYFNTIVGCPYNKPVEIIANIQFKVPQPSVGKAPYNPFIYINGNRGMEVHLVDHPPTAKADTSQFGQGDDRTDAAKGRYYRTVNNHPWALEIPEDWQYPSERKEITMAYPKFAGWAESGGASNNDWFLSNINQNAIYKAK